MACVLLVLNAAETSFFVFTDQYCRRPPPSLIYGPPCFTHPRLLGPPHTTTHGRFAPGNLLPVFSLLCELVCFFQNSLQRVVIKYSRGFSSFLLLLLLLRIHDYFFVCLLCGCILSISLFFSVSVFLLPEPSAIRCGSSWLGYLILCYFSVSFHF